MNQEARAYLGIMEYARAVIALMALEIAQKEAEVYRILWTRPGTEGGWYNDVDAADQASAAWQVAVNAGLGPDGQGPVLVGVSDLNPPVPVQE